MANKRMLAKSIWQNRKFARLKSDEKLLYIGLVTIADDEGRVWNDDYMLKIQIFPGDDLKPAEIEQMLDHIEDMELIRKNEKAIQLNGWKDWQIIRSDIFKKSTIPKVTKIVSRNATVTPPLREGNGTVTELSHSIVKLSKDKLSEESCSITESNDFDSFWKLYAKKVGRKKCIKKWSKIKKTDRDEIIVSLPAYVKSTPDKVFRMNPLTYLNGECWKDEVIELKTEDSYEFSLDDVMSELNWVISLSQGKSFSSKKDIHPVTKKILDGLGGKMSVGTMDAKSLKIRVAKEYKYAIAGIIDEKPQIGVRSGEVNISDSIFGISSEIKQS
jgi:hypothetical protein